eukprot:514715_1
MINGAQDSIFDNIYIHDVYNWADLGSKICGPYDQIHITFEDIDIQFGYTATRSHGMVIDYTTGDYKNIQIENIESYYGSAWGMVLYKGNDFDISDISVKSVYAGTQLTALEAQALALPNNMPLACSVELRDEAVVRSLNDVDFRDVVGEDIIGHKLCNNPTNNYGDLLGVCDDESCRMFAGDTMSGKAAFITTGDTYGSGGGNEDARIETAPIAVDPPALPLSYAADDAFVDIDIPDGSVGIASACNSLPDGLQYILPYGIFDETSSPLLPVICSDGNTILDASLAFDRYSAYFSSLYMYDVGIAGPQIDDFGTWREWYLPLEESDSFIYGVADNCVDTCLTADESARDTAYYMTGNFYLCAWITKGDCDMNDESYECYECARHGGRSSQVYPGVCSHVATSVDYEVHNDHFQCTGNNDNLKPAIGLKHQFCVCYNPTTSALHSSVAMEETQYSAHVALLESEMSATRADEAYDSAPVTDDGSNNIVYLSNADFLAGTYRITQPGIYILNEDIVLNFNAPSEEERASDSFSPNSYADLHWMPSTDGSQDEEYMGASTWHGPYQLGFFSGVTIETANVVIDLNGHSISMSDEFYLQQRFFSIFELAGKNFVAGQGPVDFGPYLNSASNVVIKNGIIGRTTHHGIHGNDASGIRLESLEIRNFDVAGIQLNGFDDIAIVDCDIGPGSRDIPVTGRYLHARTLLRRFGHVVDHYGDESIAFSGREARTVREYVDELIDEMDMVYAHVIDGVEYDAEDTQWLRAMDLFVMQTENGYGDGGVQYGILLNSRGGAVMGFGNAPSQSTNAVISNVRIHDLAISPLEKLKFKTNPIGGATRGPVADVFDIMKVSDSWDDIESANYVGTAYSDVQIVMSQFEKSWFVLDHTCFDAGIVDWALNGQSFANTGYYGGCNTDIQLHINKGVIGLRIDNVQGFDVNNVQIENLINTGGLGTETAICGAYTQGNAHQDPLITAGYTGTEGYGITITQSTQGTIDGASINGIETFYGNCNGIALFKDSSVLFNDVVVSNITAGSQLDVTRDLRPYQKYLPNKIPRACSVWDNKYNTEYVIGADGVHATQINGALICNADDADLIGECNNACVATYGATYFDELAQLSQDEFAQLVTVRNHDYVLWMLGSCVVLGCVWYYRSKSSEYEAKSSEYT